MTTPRDRIVLLFCHAGSFNKHVWTPIIRRLKAAPALQRFAWEHVAIDWRYHGAKSSDADAATIQYMDGDKDMPFVEHQGRYWPEWAPQDLQKVVQLLRNEDAARGRKTEIIGIGHSMGASALTNVEATSPGTFAGLILFGPPLKTDHDSHGGFNAPGAVANTLSRPGEWNSWEEVLDHFKNDKIYRRWHPESMDAFLESGVKKTSDDQRFRLAMPPIQEASLYSYCLMVLTMEEMQRMQCTAVIETGERTSPFFTSVVHELTKGLPQIFSRAEPLKGKIHFMIVEDPDTCAARIAANLEKFPVIQQALAASKL